MLEVLDFAQLQAADTTLITPNRRLAATVHRLYEKYQTQNGLRTWQTLDVLPLTSWIERLWAQHTSEQAAAHFPIRLNASQERFLWEKILLQSDSPHPLLQLTDTAELVNAAWKLLKQWQVDFDSPYFSSTEDYAALHQWALNFQHTCAQHHWIDSASLPDLISSAIASGAIVPSAVLILIGFSELPPQWKNLLTICEQKGSKVSQQAISISSAHCLRTHLPDEEAEITAMASWAKAMLTNNQKPISIGCVVPSLAQKRDRVAQLFSAVFAAETCYTVDKFDCPFNISAGKKLLQYPIINMALQLLRLHDVSLPIESFSAILLSPFLGNAETEQIKRALFDRLLREQNISFIEVRTAIQATTNKTSAALGFYCPALANHIRHFLSVLDDKAASAKDNQQETFIPNKKRSHSQWALLFNTALAALGWPGERSLNSEEYQTVENWLNLLTEFMNLDFISSSVTFEDAWQTLFKMTAKAVFQPQTPEAPIQILGTLEAASIPFDYLWVMGLDDVSWPPQPAPNPFIPKQLQRERRMPHATAERELIYCKQLIDQFKQSAPHLIFSHAEKREDLELQPSPLIRHIKFISLNELNIARYQPISERLFATKDEEFIIDEKAPPHRQAENVRGGVNVIKQQALCPFKAFAEIRLHARPLEEPSLGLNAKERGTLLHQALENIWNQLGDQASLLALNEENLHALIHQSIEPLFADLPAAFPQYFLLEKMRMQQLVYQWLQLEKARKPFKVLMSEKSAVLSLHSLTLSLRIDRIDELEDGRKLIIDYKTGKNNDIHDWLGERPDEPQLPLYALLDSMNTAGIAFAQIYPGELALKGISEYQLDIKGIRPLTEVKKISAASWQEQLSVWQSSLSRLSADFFAGIAIVDPKDLTQTCGRCSLQAFCRINEAICQETI